MGSKTFRCVRILLGGIEVTHMITKGQLRANAKVPTAVEQFYSLAV
jgi:hypothetical protein